MKSLVFLFPLAFISTSLFAADSKSCADYRNNKCYYDSSYAVSYAKKYGNRTTEPFYDYTNYSDESGNCTNFVSQAILAGFTGDTTPQAIHNKRNKYYADTRGNYNMAWYYISSRTKGCAWAGAQCLYNYAKGNKNSYRGLHFDFVTNDTPTKYMDVSKVKVGDIIFADWKSDGSIDHAMIVVKKTANNYNGITLAYHSSKDNLKTSKGNLGKINRKYDHDATFYVYRPTFYSDYGL